MNGNGHCCCVSVSGSIPETVDLLWLTSYELDATTVSVEMIQHTCDDSLLFQNLERYGWSPVRLRWQDQNEPSKADTTKGSDLSCSTSKSSTIQVRRDTWHLLCQYPYWKQLHADLFDSDHISQHLNGSVRFIPFESGASGSSVAEAKQSWEYQRTQVSENDKNNGTSMGPHNRLRAWSEILHAVVCHVMLELQLPATHLVLPHKTTVDKGKEPQPLDLLRAFRYEPSSLRDDNVMDQQALNVSQLGSSPHTDWGSWTVVWQDDTHPPCLQTYCHHCQRWNSVPSPPSSLSPMDIQPQSVNGNHYRCEAHFIIHVGDLTSLCIRQAISNLSISSKSSNNIPIADIWPSPRHRVLSPINKYRHSLVYFVYPPDTVTPTSITDSLLDWCRRNYFFSHEGKYDHYGKDKEKFIDNKTMLLPMTIGWNNYSILTDQSSSSTMLQDQVLCERRWHAVQQISVRDILQEKWKQVQR